MVTVGGLFSGIGGFELGLQRAGFKIKWFCEIDKFCLKVIRKHWPAATIFGDITSMFSAEDSPARTSRTQVNAPEYPGSVLDSGGIWCAPFAWYDRSSSSWRTWQRCLDGEWEPFSGTWPRAGMTRNGIAYQWSPLAYRIFVRGHGLFPTPQASDGMRFRFSPKQILQAKQNHEAKGTTLGSYLARDLAERFMASPTPQLSEALMGFPIGWTDLQVSATPSSRKSSNGSGRE